MSEIVKKDLPLLLWGLRSALYTARLESRFLSRLDHDVWGQVR